VLVGQCRRARRRGRRSLTEHMGNEGKKSMLFKTGEKSKIHGEKGKSSAQMNNKKREVFLVKRKVELQQG